MSRNGRLRKFISGSAGGGGAGLIPWVGYPGCFCVLPTYLRSIPKPERVHEKILYNKSP